MQDEKKNSLELYLQKPIHIFISLLILVLSFMLHYVLINASGGLDKYWDIFLVLDVLLVYGFYCQFYIMKNVENIFS